MNMANPTHATELQIRKAMQEMEMHRKGFDFACYLVTVGLNELYGFGYDRLKRLEDWMNDAMENEFHDDLEVATAGLIGCIDQIMKRGGADGREKNVCEDHH